jgi:hypothetical protein
MLSWLRIYLKRRNKLDKKYTSLLWDVKQWMDATENRLLKDIIEKGMNMLGEEKKKGKSWRRRKSIQNTCCVIFWVSMVKQEKDEDHVNLPRMMLSVVAQNT